MGIVDERQNGQTMPACAGTGHATPAELLGDGVGSLVVVLDQGTERIDEIFDLGLLHSEQIELPCDVVQLGHGLFIGDAIGIHICPLHWRSVASDDALKTKVRRGLPPESNGLFPGAVVLNRVSFFEKKDTGWVESSHRSP